MLYSVIWSTEDSPSTRNRRLDLTAKEGLWLAKLGNWTEALAVYRQQLEQHPTDFEAMLGCMRCLDASGEWRSVLDLAQQNWAALNDDTTLGDEKQVESARSRRKAIRMCAQAAWRLGQWNDLEVYSSHLTGGKRQMQGITSPGNASTRDGSLVGIDFDGAFYCAVLHIHRKEWAHAADAIDAARQAMDGRLTALLAESYSRAYPSMVTAQTLAEMEEIIEYRKVEERSHVESKQHPTNRPNEDIARDRLLSVWRERLGGCRLDSETHASILAVRSLVLGPTDEVDAILTLSKLSRQAERHKFAERVLLDPLGALNANLNGPTFGFGLLDTFKFRVDFERCNASSCASLIDQIVAGNLGGLIPSYEAMHEQWTRELVNEAGGVER
jgi:serine/threonine-protein kinase mTOR